ncbi:hypothetical protein Mgra_00007892 [Meloidogyne graminicola]|uniref:CWH43-like N-terminal domain-containing protein n=1 Tax=Meloidogyne graminicola TaxID=189291 RepID=A0A8S9ZH56_9BILA|nr:hypothetical protein Mgra_00007892 [Meloidogyne graminicola]
MNNSPNQPKITTAEKSTKIIIDELDQNNVINSYSPPLYNSSTISNNSCSSPSSEPSTSFTEENKENNLCKNCFNKKEDKINEIKIINNSEWTIRPDAKWKVRSIGLLAAILPGIACYLCLVYSFTMQNDRISNFTIPSTHCPGLKSIFPPVSYSIGVWKPQKYIWLMVLAMHLPPRFFYAIVYKNHYSLGDSIHRTKTWFCIIVKLHYFLLVIEAFGLTAVSVIDIESNFKVHAFCFALWLIPFNLNMLFNNLLHYHSGIRKLRPMHDRVFQLKCILFLFGYPLSMSTGFSYLTFVLTCSTIPYATFSLAEYFLIGINSINRFKILFYFLEKRKLGTEALEFKSFSFLWTISFEQNFLIFNFIIFFFLIYFHFV